MSSAAKRVYVGFGFGAIQAGLFLLEASRTGRFDRLVVVEVVPEVVAGLREAGGIFRVDIATADGIEERCVGPVEVFDPSVDSDRRAIVEAIAAASEIGTAIPSVRFYTSEGPSSLHRVLADGLALKLERDGPRAVVYAAENHNEAAEILERHVRDALPEAKRSRLRESTRFLNTVIGKMSGVVAVSSNERRAFLVEAFNRILISRVDFETPFERGIDVFEEKSDLRPFEESKLYGHNACHALAAYVGAVAGIEHVADVAKLPGGMPFLRAALIEESGMPLVEKHAGVDPLFTHEGFRGYADDLLPRMVNPHLRDTVERVARDPERKLGWNDRLVGAMRLALAHEVRPRRYAIGVAAALAWLDPGLLETGAATTVDGTLGRLWPDKGSAVEVESVRHLVLEGLARLRAWRGDRVPDLELLVDDIGGMPT